MIIARVLTVATLMIISGKNVITKDAAAQVATRPSIGNSKMIVLIANQQPVLTVVTAVSERGNIILLTVAPGLIAILIQRGEPTKTAAQTLALTITVAVPLCKWSNNVLTKVAASVLIIAIAASIGGQFATVLMIGVGITITFVLAMFCKGSGGIKAAAPGTAATTIAIIGLIGRVAAPALIVVDLVARLALLG